MKNPTRAFHRLLLTTGMLSACLAAVASHTSAQGKSKAETPVIKLADLPENWAGPTSIKPDTNKCSDLIGLIKPGSTSTQRVRFENGYENLVNAVALFQTAAAADAAFARIPKWSNGCATRHFKFLDKDYEAMMSEVNFKPLNGGFRFKAFEETAVSQDRYTIEVRIVFYRKGLAVGVLALARHENTQLLKDVLQIATSRV